MIIQIPVAAIMVVVFLGDAIAYGAAKYPERRQKWYYRVPGGGYLALFQLGRDR